MPSSLLEVCPACGGRQFTAETILWPELLDDWKLSPGEVDYINLQQGFSCVSCKNNLRSMTLAAAVTRAFGFDGSLEHLCARNSAIRQLTVIEMNPAGNLSSFLRLLPRHALHSFPQTDMRQMSFASASIDIIIHSDTLEHVSDSRAALRESHRVLKPGGRLFYTVPIVVGRLTRTRQGLPPSYHGNPNTSPDDFKVETEYGADVAIFDADTKTARCGKRPNRRTQRGDSTANRSIPACGCRS